MEVQKTVFMLMAQDMSRAIEFYNETIGLELRVNYGGWAELGGDDAVVALHAGGDGEYRSTGLGFTVADVAAACDEWPRPAAGWCRPRWSAKARALSWPSPPTPRATASA